MTSSTTLNLVHADLIGAVACLRDVVSVLEEERRSADRAVDTLLDGGWSGRASGAFREGWEDWRAGCHDVLGALSTMAELIAGARADQAELDDAVAAHLRALASDPVTGAASAAGQKTP